MAIGSQTILKTRRGVPLLGAARLDDRWRGFDGKRPLGRFAGVVVVASLMAHAAAIVAALFWMRRDPPAPQPIPVELVQEPAPPTPPAAAAARAEKPAPPPLQSAKPPEPAKPPQPSAAERQAAQRATLERELADLKAEQEALKRSPAEKAADEKAEKAAQEKAAKEAARGKLLDSIQGLVLPSAAADGDIVVGYKTLVFSQLARAKQGFPPGSADGVAGIVFAVDEDGTLRDVKVAVSSGVKSLDEEAEAIVRHASPFPRPPEGAQRSFSVNVSFAVPPP